MTIRSTTTSHKLATLATGMAVLAAGAVAMAAPASADTGTNVRACFQWSDGAPAANFTLQLAQSGYGVIRTGKTDSSGCGTFYNVTRNTSYSIASKWQNTQSCPGWFVSSGSTGYRSIGGLTGTYGLGTIRNWDRWVC